MADKLMLYKYVVKNVARAHGLTATFMPKPIFQDNGSGMHVHSSLWSGGEPLFYSELGYAGLSDIGPLVHRRPAQARPGHLGLRGADDQQLQALGAGLRGAGQPGLQPAQPLGRLPHPAVLEEPEGQAGRVPLPRPVVQPVPGLLGHLDGRPRRRAEQDRAARPGGQGPLRPAARGTGLVPQVPGSLEESLAALEADNDFLKAGGVFTDDLIETWIAYKRANEIDPVRLRPHPWEFHLYYDI